MVGPPLWQAQSTRKVLIGRHRPRIGGMNHASLLTPQEAGGRWQESGGSGQWAVGSGKKAEDGRIRPICNLQFPICNRPSAPHPSPFTNPVCAVCCGRYPGECAFHHPDPGVSELKLPTLIRSRRKAPHRLPLIAWCLVWPLGTAQPALTFEPAPNFVQATAADTLELPPGFQA